ncbi:ABC-F family ATP-binding cassette domain-containing protein [Rapidithrix thailandica]|uniref:ABC-F family ATP-binding cassette domain-containing protein n=1 Tax=Rapidithrix thailandica TaxID=413964 RepID=A0AAW9SBM1_9BACT
MLAIQNLSFHYGSRTIYEDASLHIKPKNRIGLVGLNGTGKTTLLKLIYGDLTPDAGTISKANDCTIGFLNQDLLSYQSDDSILKVAMQAFEKELKLQSQINQVIKQLEEAYEEDLVHKLTQLQEEFEALDGYTIQSKAEEILEGLGFSTEDLQRPLWEFSGGWRMRVMLAKLLLQKPSVLMLDEPTNHLDLPSIEWLENYLSNYEGAVIIVSHDREFLDRAVNTIVEVSGGKLQLYSGNYTFYLEEKELRNEIQRNAFKNQQQKIKQTEQFINRFRAKATKARQVQSKMKLLEKMDKVEEVTEEIVDLNIRFTFQQQPGKIIFRMENVSKAFGEKIILQESHATIERGDKIALIGANGKGKSTQLRIIAGTEPVTGHRETGYNVLPAFYAQHQLEALGIENEILEELKQAGSGKTEKDLRSVLGCFLFSGDDVFKKIKVLSGGEKSRVALAKTLISEANFLLLDEPTNHLDIQSVNLLIQALNNYEGSFITVSHDRHFIANVANKIWYIEEHQIKEYPGTYGEYLTWKNEQEAKQEVAQPEKSLSKKKEKKKSYNDAEFKERQKQRRKLENKVKETEQKIDELETLKQQLEGQMADPEIYSDNTKLSELSAQYEQVKSDVESTTKEWENAVVRLEEFDDE